MGINFPSSPANGQIFGHYVWDGQKWKLNPPSGGPGEGLAISVKDPSFAGGAVGDGSHDDTAAIQAAFNFAFGQPNGHGINNYLNLAVHFPPGNYVVKSPKVTTITALMGGNGSNVILMVADITGIATGDLVYVSGVGGMSPGINECYAFFIDISGSNITLRESHWVNGTYSGGGEIKKPCLLIKNTQGGRIFGAGKIATTINSGTANTGTLAFDGWGYGSLEHISISAAAGGTACEMNWSYAGVSTQAGTIFNCTFGGGYHGFVLGRGGYMSSEFTFFHCHFGGTTKSGLLVANFNSLQHQIFGGQFQNCSKGIHVAAGSVPVIHGVGFQGNEYDINVQNSVGDGMSIHSCRLEGNTPASHTFAWLHAGINAHIAGCTDSCDNDTNHFLFTESGGGPTPPSDAAGVGNVCIDSCTSVNGDIIGNGRIFIRSNAGNKAFGNPAYLANFNGLVVENNRGPITVAQLTAEFPPAAKFKGLRQFVTDANATAFMGNVAGGGANSVPVICDGTNWKIG